METVYYLSHGGPGSGRYPLGSGDRPYQKFEGRRGRSSGISGYIKTRRSQKLEEKRRKNILDEEEKKRQHEADRERVLKSGSASEVMKYQGELTNRELQDAFTRIDLERKLSSFSASEVKSGMQKMDKAMSNLKTINNWSSTITESYNMMASVYNATEQGKKNPWPIIEKSGGKKKQ